MAYAWNTDNDSINNCVFEGNVEGTNAGGIVGFIPQNGWGAIKNCTNNAKIIATYNAGGIVGFLRTNRHTFEKCINNGTIDAGVSGGIIRIALSR